MFCWNTDGNYEWTAGRVKWKSLNFTNSGNVWNIFIRKKNKHLGRARQIYLVFKGNVLWAPSPIWPLLFLPKSLGWVLFCSSPPHKEVPTHPVHCFTLWKPGLFSCWHPGWTQEAHFLATKIEHIRGSQFMYNRVKNSHNFRSTGSFIEKQVETMLEKKEVWWNNAICSNMDRPRDYHAKWSKSKRTNITWYHTCGIENMTQMNLSMKQTHRHWEQTCVCPRGPGRDGLGVWDQQMWTVMW